MKRFFGRIGFADQVESSPDVWTDQIVERDYYGEVRRNGRRLDGSDSINMTIKPDNVISVIADAYAVENFYNLKYVVWNGVKWIVTSVEVQRPRLNLTLGSEYQGGN